MIEVLGALGDDLETALDLTIAYLRAGVRVPDAKGLSQHLADASNRLRGYYKEFKVCQGLYTLRDEFKQVFNPKRFAVSLKNFWNAPALAEQLSRGERSVLDDLSNLLKRLEDAADALNSRRSRTEIERVHRILRKAVEDLEERKAAIKRAVRRAADTL